MSDNEIHKALRDLGIEPGASWDDVAARYKLLVRMWHSDRARPEDKAVADQELKKINNARDLLKEHYKSAAHVTSGYCRCQPIPVSAEPHPAASAPPPPPPRPEPQPQPETKAQSGYQSQSQSQSSGATQPGAQTHQASQSQSSGSKAASSSTSNQQNIIFGLDFNKPKVVLTTLVVGLLLMVSFCNSSRRSNVSEDANTPITRVTVPVRYVPPPPDPRLVKNQAEIDKRMAEASQKATAVREIVRGYQQSMTELAAKINKDYAAGLDTEADKAKLKSTQDVSSRVAGEAVRLEMLVKEIGKLRANDPNLSFESVDNELAKPVQALQNR
ncbi:MAG: hypothetical protein QG625_4606 [Cyanobacteriota bacterium erpe_2018_sw_39hr_WHONDRS-SW48-000098_B_bin.30]|nr:hypothetical protein [Cyanobacteriota bacterium erpe_2018_sw_39hr_WHONDRS-SW48-000098_B_bin.30]